jgi:hypothetical protein
VRFQLPLAISFLNYDAFNGEKLSHDELLKLETKLSNGFLILWQLSPASANNLLRWPLVKIYEEKYQKLKAVLCHL